MDFHVAGPFELFKNNIIHPATSVNKSCRHNGETAAVFDVAGRPKEPLRPLERVRIQPSRQHLAAWRRNCIVGTRQASNAIQQHDDIFLMFDQSLGLFEHHFGHLGMALGRLIEGGADDFGLHLPLPVGDFFRPLVDEQHD